MSFVEQGPVGVRRHAAACRRALPLICLALLAAVWFVGLGYRPLFGHDEGRYAEIAREMVVSGNWVTPRLNGLRYFEKPPLQYWVTATAYEVFGIHGWCARLWPALASFLTIILAAFAARRLYGKRSAWAAGALLASSFYFGLFGHTNDLDAGLTLAMTLTLFSLVFGLRAAPRSRAALGWMLVAYAGAALAVLSKGLIGILLPGGTFVLYLLLKRDWGLLRRLYIVRGLLVFLVLTLPWFVAVSVQNHDFLWQFFMVQEFLRFLTPIASRSGAWWYFLPILILAMLPWLVPAARALGRPVRALIRRGPFCPTTLLWLWVVFIFVFFSLSHSKLPPYILPVVPALAVLVAPVVADDQRAPWSAYGLSIVLGAAMLAGGATASSWLPHADRAMTDALAPWIIAGGCVILTIGLVCCFLARRRLVTVVAVSAAWLLATRLILLGGSALAPWFSTVALAHAVVPYNRPDVPVYAVGGYQQSLPFYLGRTMTLVAYQGELAFGIKHARRPLSDRYLPSLQAFARLWRHRAKGLAFAPRKALPAIRHLDIRFRVVAQSPRWVAFVPENKP
ncbi:MAG TPA: glycosyltransferase family 39 protein [Rhodanobacteraceae bacterium]